MDKKGCENVQLPRIRVTCDTKATKQIKNSLRFLKNLNIASLEPEILSKYPSFYKITRTNLKGSLPSQKGYFSYSN